jgi:ABC-2 type transport system permease protein
LFLVNALNSIGGLFAIAVLYTRFQGIGGWTVDELVFLYGFNRFIWGAVLVVAQPVWYMPRLIISGQFDLLLVRPLNVLWLHMARGFNYMDMSSLIVGAGVVVYSLNRLGFELTVASALYFLLLTVLCILIRTAVFLVGSSTCFWWKNRETVRTFFAMMFAGMENYPLTVLPVALQFFLTFIIPIGFASYYPAALILDIENGYIAQQSLLPAMIILAIGLSVFSYLFFHFSLRRYESAGH